MITTASIWVIGFLTYLLSPPDPPSRWLFSQSLGFWLLRILEVTCGTVCLQFSRLNPSFRRHNHFTVDKWSHKDGLGLRSFGVWCCWAGGLGLEGLGKQWASSVSEFRMLSMFKHYSSGFGA